MIKPWTESHQETLPPADQNETGSPAAALRALGVGSLLISGGCGGGGGGGSEGNGDITASGTTGSGSTGGNNNWSSTPSSFTVIDPVTRIEGHLKVSVDIDTVDGVLQVIDARCTGTQFRGFEQILAGRDPQDAPYLTERICGVCPVSHGLASTLALEKAAGSSVPSNARLLRNLVLGANFLQSHILHFYLLAALDYVTARPGLRPGMSI